MGRCSWRRCMESPCWTYHVVCNRGWAWIATFHCAASCIGDGEGSPSFESADAPSRQLGYGDQHGICEAIPSTRALSIAPWKTTGLLPRLAVDPSEQGLALGKNWGIDSEWWFDPQPSYFTRIMISLFVLSRRDWVKMGTGITFCAWFAFLSVVYYLGYNDTPLFLLV